MARKYDYEFTQGHYSNEFDLQFDAGYQFYAGDYEPDFVANLVVNGVVLDRNAVAVEVEDE